jgi:predicted Zn-ribbon and HTH transcriptional regulator
MGYPYKCLNVKCGFKFEHELKIKNKNYPCPKCWSKGIKPLKYRYPAIAKGLTYKGIGDD